MGTAVDIHIHVSAPINITPFVARQTVNAFVVAEISSQLRGEPPNLIVGEPCSGRCGWCSRRPSVASWVRLERFVLMPPLVSCLQMRKPFGG